MELDLEGLVAILLMNNSFEGRTLLRGVRRLGPGRALVWDRTSAVREVLQYEPPRVRSDSDENFSEHVRSLGDAVEDPVSRQASEGPCALMLSGGRDSRLLGGYLRATQPNAIAVTLGQSSDIEVRVREASRQSSWVRASSDRDRRRSIRPLRDAPGDVGTHRYGLQHDSSVGRLRFRVLMSETSSQAS